MVSHSHRSFLRKELSGGLEGVSHKWRLFHTPYTRGLSSLWASSYRDSHPPATLPRGRAHPCTVGSLTAACSKVPPASEVVSDAGAPPASPLSRLLQQGLPE